MTKARLGDDSLEPERLLTKSLRPVREVMAAEDLNFNQLLQRDLDDHRVATDLVKYLLKPRSTGPAFFPPIVAVLLPFRNKRPSKFPHLEDPQTIESGGMFWAQQDAGDAFQVRRLVDQNGKAHSVNLAQLRWNSTAAQIVVLDGQHRAMALLAVDRTLSRTWQDNEGAKYRSFYESQVERYLREFDPNGDLDLSQIEVPVTVCWFPDKTGAEAQPHEAARQLFVDVNKEARPPSESRIILLSDAELVNVLTRSLLNELRAGRDDDLLPLYAVEYDNPDVNNSRPARWSVLTNINLLKMAVTRCVFGHPKYLRDVAQKFGGVEKKAEKDSFMREQLEVENLFPMEISDGDFSYRRSQLGNENFPLGHVERLSEQFSSTWGVAILNLLSGIAPYKAHNSALVRMENDWSTAIEPFASLARDALFGGVGVYWTLKDSYEHFREEIRQDKAATTRSKSDDVIKAWNLIERKKSDFDVLRSSEYLSSTAEMKVERSKKAFEVMNTHACQLGLVLALGSLWELRKQFNPDWIASDLPSFSRDIVRACNSYFETSHAQGTQYDRRLVFAKSSPNPINRISNMDTPRSVYFRYFWLEIISSNEGWPALSRWFQERAKVVATVERARALYLEYCVEERLKVLKSTAPTLSGLDLKEQASELAKKDMRTALNKWFLTAAEELDPWFEKIGQSGDPAGILSVDKDEDGVPESLSEVDDSEETQSAAATLEELLAEGAED
ncbi:DNA sulfur modification protein DndB [Rhodococcus sp. GXMU-t2271]|uniref:hypothetical protein n=1 Tax=Rhodococcus sp. GXMU-t2271 TaxID=3059079 RepID=UPI00352AD1F4